MATPAQIETVTRHFIIAALWADCEEGTNPRAAKATQETARRMIQSHNAAMMVFAAGEKP